MCRLKLQTHFLFLYLVGALACSFAISISAFAEPVNTSVVDFDLSQSRYLGEAVGSNQSSQYTFLSLDANLKGENRPFRFAFNPVFSGAVDAKNEAYFGVPELYIQPKDLVSGFSLTIGRKLRRWSYLDEEFNLGLWQPQLRWDYLAPKQQGLIGLFFDWELSKNVQFFFMTSPLFLPDQGPNYQLRNGTFTSSNRWFVAPQSEITLFQGSANAKDAPLSFEIDRPSNERFVMNSSFAFGMKYTDDHKYWGGFNYAYKPRNQIHLGIECENCGQISGVPVEITAVIHPTIVKHHVLTVETGFERPDDRGWLSVTGDFPGKSDFPADYEESPHYSSIITGGAYEHFIPPVLGVSSWVKVAYLHTTDISRSSKKGLASGDQVYSSLDRYPYLDLGVLEWRMRLLNQRTSRLEFANRYHYAARERGGWLASSLAYTSNSVIYSLGVDVLGSDLPVGSREAGLFTRYRSNDRVYGGIGYVF